MKLTTTKQEYEKFTLRTNSIASEMKPNQPPLFCTAASVVEAAVSAATAGSAATAASASV